MTTINQPTRELMTRRETSEYLHIAKSTLDKLDIPKIQIRRRIFFRREAVNKWLIAQETKTTTGTKA